MMFDARAFTRNLARHWPLVLALPLVLGIIGFAMKPANELYSARYTLEAPDSVPTEVTLSAYRAVLASAPHVEVTVEDHKIKLSARHATPAGATAAVVAARRAAYEVFQQESASVRELINNELDLLGEVIASWNPVRSSTDFGELLSVRRSIRSDQNVPAQIDLWLIDEGRREPLIDTPIGTLRVGLLAAVGFFAALVWVAGFTTVTERRLQTR